MTALISQQVLKQREMFTVLAQKSQNITTMTILLTALMFYYATYCER